MAIPDLVVMAVLFLGRPGGLCIRACCFFSWFLCCLPINNFLWPMTVDTNMFIIVYKEAIYSQADIYQKMYALHAGIIMDKVVSNS